MLKQKLKHLIQNNYLSFTIDKWSSSRKDSYYGISVHFINKKWRYINLVLCCKYSESTSSTALDTLNEFQQCVMEYEINVKNIVAVVSDTENTMRSFGKKIIEQGINWFACSAHLLELLSSCACKSDNLFDPTNNKHNNVKNVIKKSKKLIGHFKHSNINTKLLRQVQKHDNVVDLIEDVPTRWWSTCQMIKRLIELKLSISYLCDNNDVDKDYNLNAEEWILLENISDILDPIRYAQKFLEGENYVTISCVFPIVILLRKQLNELFTTYSSSGNKDICESISHMLIKLEKDWGNLEEVIDIEVDTKNRIMGIQNLHGICTILDPRLKNMQFLDEELKQHFYRILFQHLLQEFPNTNINHNDNNENNSNTTSSNDNNYNKRTKTTKNNEYSISNFLANAVNNNICADVHITNQDVLQNEFNDYLNSNFVEWDINPLDWWALHQYKYYHLSALARKFLAITATSAPVERIFSTAGLVISNKRSRLDTDLAELIILLKKSNKIVNELYGNHIRYNINTNNTNV